MAQTGNKVRLQAMVDKDLAEKIRQLADALRISESAMVSALLEEAVSTDEWIIRITAAVKRIIRGGPEPKAKKAAQGGES